MRNAVFEPMELAGIAIKNKIIRSATHEGMADADGAPTEQLKNLYLQMAKGEVGAIITGYAGIRQNGKSPLYRMLMIDDDRLVPRYKELTDAVHGAQTPIVLQIAHCGRQTRSKVSGEPTVAPSAIKDKAFPEDVPKELTEQDIDELINCFVDAIRRAKDAGFDGVQLHAAHGYLLAQFLSPYMNRRNDRWGGTTENRFRIIREIYARARTVVGDYPILIKLNACDGRKGGMRVEEAVKIAQMLEQAGCSAIEVSCGIIEDGFYSIRGEKFPFEAAARYTHWYKSSPSWMRLLAKPLLKIMFPPVRPVANYNVGSAQTIKSNVSIPVIVVGGIASIDDISDILQNRKADCVSMCRPFIHEPQIVKKLREGHQERSRCIKCNYCVMAAEERPLECYYGRLKG